MKFKDSKHLYNYWISQPMALRGLIAWKNIRTICDALEREGMTITTYNVGKRIEQERLTPNKKTLWNNKNFCEYIKMRGMEVEFLGKEVVLDGLSGDEKLIEVIRELKRENEVLRGLVKGIKIIGYS